MAGRISDDDRERVRDANSIEQVVAEYVALRPSGGGNRKGLCPFHDEKTPSFQVNPARGYFHCFGCGQGGDVFAFVQQIEHLTFVEAVQRLADRAGVTLTLVQGGTSTHSERGTRSRLIAANKAAAEFYAGQLATDEAEPARSFLSERGFDLDAAARYGCGYAPSGWDRLVAALIGKGFAVDELYRAGLAKQGQRGPIDQFHRRLLWPIRDGAGDVVGFGARRLFDDDRLRAKYVNTAETPLYKKSQVLFGLDLAKRDIVRQRQVVVVEGYTDVMAMHLAGVTTAVASCGTAFGEEHISVLRRYLLDTQPPAGGEVVRGEVVYTFDGDAAGRNAALKAFGSDQRFAANTFVAIVADGMDPCDLRRHRGDEAVRALVHSRRPLFEFAIRSTLDSYDLDTAEGRVAGADAVVPLVAAIKEQTLREEYTRQLAGWLGAELEPVRSRVRRQVAAALRRGGPGGGAIPDRQSGSPARPAVAHRNSSGSPTRPESGGRVRGAGAPATGSTPDSRAAADSRPEGAAVPAGAPAMRRPDPMARTSLAEREFLKLVLQQPALVASGYRQVAAQSFTEPAYAAVHGAVEAAGGPPADPARAVWVETVAEQLPAGPLRSLVSELAVEPPRQRADQVDTRYAGAILARMAERAALAEERRLRSALQRAEADGDRDLSRDLNRDLSAMALYRRALADRARGES